ncbi:hypothetical protein KEM48_002313 [Puccinia striiformis f. sp. tritici PST-130]|nr:hypothetical protein KEM48_002313 [Puccinia striiformis f. sp. tritici PST-130]
MAKIITDNLVYAKIVKTMGIQTNHSKTDFSEILPEELEGTLKADFRFGSTSYSILGLTSNITDAIPNRAIRIPPKPNDRYRPNLTAILGELVGAQLIAHSGSLISLAKAPASTIQILGAEKALFRALKTNSLVGRGV